MFGNALLPHALHCHLMTTKAGAPARDKGSSLPSPATASLGSSGACDARYSHPRLSMRIPLSWEIAPRRRFVRAGRMMTTRTSCHGTHRLWACGRVGVCAASGSTSCLPKASYVPHVRFKRRTGKQRRVSTETREERRGDCAVSCQRRCATSDIALAAADNVAVAVLCLRVCPALGTQVQLRARAGGPEAQGPQNHICPRKFSPCYLQESQR